MFAKAAFDGDLPRVQALLAQDPSLLNRINTRRQTVRNLSLSLVLV